MDPSQLKRVVTGLDARGRSVIVSDGPAPCLLDDDPAAWVADAWVIDAPVPDVDDARDLAASEPWAMTPPDGGSTFRLYEIPPGGSSGMHATPTLDYVVVISGHVWLVLDEGEVELGPGDCAIQRATVHSWENRRDVPCVAAAVLLSAHQPNV